MRFRQFFIQEIGSKNLSVTCLNIIIALPIKCFMLVIFKQKAFAFVSQS